MVTYDGSPETPVASNWQSVSIDLSQAIKAIRVLNIAHMRDRFKREVASTAQRLWINAVTGYTLPGMTYDVHDPQYAQAIANTNAVTFTEDGVELDPQYDRMNSYEDGIDDYDMKPGFLAHGAKMSKEGDLYKVVPFRHGTPGQTGEGVGFATIMPQPTYDVAQTLEQGEELLQDGGEITKPQLQSMSAPYTHTASLHQGMRKYGKKGSARYMTFRTVSEKSDANAWHHPGKPENPIIDSVAQTLENEILPEIMSRLIGKK
jgi:hypothetical protein